MLISQRPTPSEDALTDNRSQFVIELLELGFGLHPGQFAASHFVVVDFERPPAFARWCTARITTVPGVKEDVTEINPESQDLRETRRTSRSPCTYARIRDTAGDIAAGLASLCTTLACTRHAER